MMSTTYHDVYYGMSLTATVQTTSSSMAIWLTGELNKLGLKVKAKLGQGEVVLYYQEDRQLNVFGDIETHEFFIPDDYLGKLNEFRQALTAADRLANEWLRTERMVMLMTREDNDNV